ncbi:MAG TPA: hypothetical protein VEB22_07920 [Phycisphaerales bacterium]|nr:hypothetical protein [Phycisphaerales bacterium]
MLSSLHLVSLNPDRAIVGHAPRDKFTAEMALGHLGPLFERVLGRRLAISLMQVKGAPPSPEGKGRGGGGGLDLGSGASAAQPQRPTPAAPDALPVSSSRAPAAAPPAAPAAAPRATAASAVDVEAAKANPLVQRAAELLGAKVVRITARTDTPPSP